MRNNFNNIKTFFLAIFLLVNCNVYSMQIFVKSYIDGIQDRTYTLEVQPTDDVYDVRTTLASRTGYPLSSHYQLFFGSTLLVDGYTLGDYNIVLESTLRLYLDSSTYPVELITFTASVSLYNIILDWQTATEVNNYGFEIQRTKGKGTSEKKWETIGFVQGNGNSNSPKIYSFKDNLNGNSTLIYRLKQIDTDGQFKYSNEVEINLLVPSNFSVMQNYPNPFNPTTTINYEIPTSPSIPLLQGEGLRERSVSLKIYDILGRVVEKLVDEPQNPGKYSVQWNASKYSSGIYYYELVVGDFRSIKKMILMK